MVSDEKFIEFVHLGAQLLGKDLKGFGYTNHMKWISVEDRFPEHDQLVLACTTGYLPQVLFAKKTSLQKCIFLLAENPRLQHVDITHWIPLPKNPSLDK